MGAQVFSLEQVCKERAGRHLPRDARTQQKLSTREATTIQMVETHYTETNNKLHEVLRQLVMALTSSLSLHDILQALTTLMIQALGMDLCVVLLQEQEDLHITTCTPDLSDKGVI